MREVDVASQPDAPVLILHAAAAMGTPEPDIIQFGYAFLRQYKTVWDFSERKIYLLTP